MCVSKQKCGYKRTYLHRSIDLQINMFSIGVICYMMNICYIFEILCRIFKICFTCKILWYIIWKTLSYIMHVYKFLWCIYFNRESFQYAFKLYAGLVFGFILGRKPVCYCKIFIISLYIFFIVLKFC